MKVLDKGYIELLDSMGDEQTIVNAARVSMGASSGPIKEPKSSDSDLIRKLWVDGHTSPFEHVVLSFKVKAPIFVLRQWMRHRTWSYSEVSMRYTESAGEFYVPTLKRCQFQGYSPTRAGYSAKDNMRTYDNFIKDGMPRELARIVLPVSMYSEVTMTVDLSNLLKFLQLRLASGAQQEIREYAEIIHDMMLVKFPTVMEVFNQELWVANELKSAKKKLRKRFTDGQSLTPLSTSELGELLSATESKSSDSVKEKGTTKELTEEEENDREFIKLWFDIEEKSSPETLNDLVKSLESRLKQYEPTDKEGKPLPRSFYGRFLPVRHDLSSCGILWDGTFL